ncbi:translation machinery-associated protein 16-like isoform X2 [Dreissena polymorpha]|uniref:translation machinery-associated protein 16-like isoform X2 n=1 Tax=Dreissena polymorpha TaxID=45954 RepID=UPI00226525E0|nr:translation machinery-associated protein 16-like isoform X2 [Dreissena polymorpha]
MTSNMPKAPKVQVVKSKKVVHPNSRQASYIQRRVNHDNRVVKSKVDTSMKQDQLQQKLVWFQEHLDPEKASYSKSEVAELTVNYLNRFEDQLEQISIVNSIGNRQQQHVSRESAIRITMEKEQHEFDTIGIEVPDLVNGKALNVFRNWTGEAKYHPNIKMRKSRRADIHIPLEGACVSTSDTKPSQQDSVDADLPDYIEQEEK